MTRDQHFDSIAESVLEELKQISKDSLKYAGEDSLARKNFIRDQLGRHLDRAFSHTLRLGFGIRQEELPCESRQVGR